MRVACWNWLYTDELHLIENLHKDFDYHAKISDQNDINTRWNVVMGALQLFGGNILKFNDYR